MPSITTPYFGIQYGWAFGEDGWNVGMDQNLYILSFLQKGTVDDFVSSLPVMPVDGMSVVNTTDNQIYLYKGAWIFLTVPSGFSIKNQTNGITYTFNGTSYVAQTDASSVQTNLTNFQADVQNSSNSLKGASLVGYKNRTVYDKLTDRVSVKDYGTVVTDSTVASALSANNGLVYFPQGAYSVNLPTTYSPLLEYDGPNTPINVYQQSGETTRFAKKVFRGQTSNSSHVGLEYSVVHVEGVMVGSSASGPTNADYGLTVSLIKKDFPTTTVSGEIDGMNIVVRNGGPDSDTTCWLGNVSHYGVGFTAVFEASSSNVVSNVTEHAVQIQAGIINNRENNYIGYFTSANTGTLDDAFRCDHLPGGSWTNFFRGIRDGIERFRVSSGGNIFMRGATGGQKMIGVLNGTFRVVNDAGTQELFTVDESGNGTVFGSLSGNSLRVGGVQTVGPRDTGWAAMTGTGNKNTTYDTSTITLQQLATRVNSIQAALTAHGLIGT